MDDLIIPPLPTVVLNVIKFDANNPKHGAADLEAIVAPDRVISADLLRVSNSAFYGRSGKVKLLRDALAVLGTKATKNLVIYLSTRILTPTAKSETFRKHLNQYPIFAALFAQRLALESPHKTLADECFLGTLLQSIGMNIIAQSKQLHYSSMIEACEKNNWDLLKLEKTSYGSTHVELGKKAAAQWGLPAQYARLMEISTASEAPTLVTPTEQITYVAIWLAMNALNIPSHANASENAKALCAALGISNLVLARFAQNEFVEELKLHPFAQMAGA